MKKIDQLLRISLLSLSTATIVIQSEADTLTVNGSDQSLSSSLTASPAINFQSNHSVTLFDNIQIIGTILTTENSQGSLIFEGNSIVTGDIANHTLMLDTVTLNQSNQRVILQGNLAASQVHIANNGHLIFNNNTTITTSITSGNNGNGQLTFAGDGTLSGNIANNTVRFGNIHIQGNAALVSLTGEIYANNIFITNNAQLTIGENSNLTITTALASTNNGQGSIQFSGSSTITGNLGGDQSINTLNQMMISGATVTLNGHIGDGVNRGADTLHFTNNGHLHTPNRYNIHVTAITTAENSTGVLSFSGQSTVTGSIGNQENQLDMIYSNAVDQAVTFCDVVYSNIIVLSNQGQVALKDHTQSNVAFWNIQSNNSQLTLASNKNLTGSIITNTINRGTVVTEGSATITGTIGNSSTMLGQFIANGGLTHTLNLTGDVYSETLIANAHINFSGHVNSNQLHITNDINLTIATNKTLLAPVTTSQNNQGRIIFNHSSTVSGSIGNETTMLKAIYFQGDATLKNNLYAKTIETNSTLTLGTGIQFNTLLNIGANQTLNLSTYTLTGGIDAQLNFSNNATIGLSLSNQNQAGSINLSTNSTANRITLANNTTIQVTTAQSDTYIPNNTQYTLINSANSETLHVTPEALSVIDDSVVLSFTLSKDQGHLLLTAKREAGGYHGLIASQSPAQNLAQKLDHQATETTDTNMQSLLDYLDRQKSVSALQEALEELTPDTSGHIIHASKSASTQALHTSQTRLSMLRGNQIQAKAYDYQGISSGDGMIRHGLWLHTLLTSATQENSNTDSGYDLESFTIGAGYDLKPWPNWMLGIALANTRAKILSNNQNETNIDSWQLTFYGSHEFHQWYLEGFLGYAQHNYTAQRQIALEQDYIASASYQGQGWSLNLTGGSPLIIEKMLTITPTLGFSYHRLDQDAYQEQHADPFNLAISAMTDQNTDLHLGLQLDYSGKAYPYWLYGLNLSMYWDYTLWQTAIEQPAIIPQLDALAFQTPGNTPSKHRFRINPTLTLESVDQFTFSVAYNGIIKDDYISHTGSARARWTF
ncbi:autotransporter outer membrane beta-barrel domain-containing protein [Magnetococcales bacterium HHB-1]